MISLCGDYRCAYGCIGNCVPRYQIPARPAPYKIPEYKADVPSRGCICPPGANKDCENPACPRKDPMGIVSK